MSEWEKKVNWMFSRYGEEDLAGAKSLVDQCPADDPDTEINLACLLFKESRFTEALAKFQVDKCFLVFFSFFNETKAQRSEGTTATGTQLIVLKCTTKII